MRCTSIGRTEPPPSAPVRILSIGRGETTERLRDMLPPWCELAQRDSVSDAQRLVDVRKCDVMMLDPAAFRFDMQFPLLKSAADAGIGVVLYAGTDRESARGVVKVMRLFTCELVSVGAEFERSLLEHCFRSPSRIAAPSLVAGELAPNLIGLDSDVRAAFVGYLGGIRIPADIAGLVDLTGSNERRLERMCVQRRLAPPNVCMVGAHVAHSWAPLQSGEAISEIAASQRWGTSDRYRSGFRSVSGFAPTHARERMQTPEFAHQAANSMRISNPTGPAI
jgi:hypothetical protein